MQPLQKLKTGAQLVLFPLKQRVRALAQRVGVVRGGDANHGHAMEEFYAEQAKSYDAFRERFLWARAPMIASLPVFPLQKGEKCVWLDIGCGTGRNLEYFPPEVLRACFSQIVIVDISPSLLKVAQERVDKYELGDLIEVRCGDVHDAGFVRTLPHSANIVTFSYSLSMIPNKVKAVQTARSLLAPRGVLAIADFFFESPSGNSSMLRAIEASLQAAWFRQDGVHLLRPADVAPVLRSTGKQRALEHVFLDRFRGAVPLLPILRPFHGVFIAQAQ